MTDEPDLASYLTTLRQDIEQSLERALAASTAPPGITNAMRYSLMGGGKRLRPCVTLAVAEAVAVPLNLELTQARTLAMPGACAVEMVHTYSLIHDDLPAMDDDALRRGRPTSHVVHGDGMAVLAGDGLLTEAFTVLARAPSPVLPRTARTAPPDRRLRAIERLAAAAGPAGMVGGQAIDLAAAGRVRNVPAAVLDPAELEDMHARKTGALIRAAATIGAVLAGADDRTIDVVDDYAREIGLAFQIIDDVLDVEGSNEALGKTAGKDAAAGKPTYPALYGLDESRRLAAGCVERANTALATLGLEGRLRQIAEWSLTRKH